MRAYEIKIWPEGQESIWRLVGAADKHTLHQLSLVINREFGLHGEHLYCFYMGDKPYDSKTAYGGPNAEAPRLATKASLGTIGLKRGRRFVYLFNFVDERLFRCQVERVANVNRCPPMPEVLKRAGSVPVSQPKPPPELPQELEALEEELKRAAEAASEGKRRSKETLTREFELARKLAGIVAGRWDLVRALEKRTQADISGWLVALPEALASEGLVDQALEVIDRFTELEPSSFLNEKPLLLAQAGKLEEAARQAEENVQAFEGDPWITAKAAELFSRIGRTERAEELFRKALDQAGNAYYLRDVILERLLALLEETGKSEAARRLAEAEERRRAKPTPMA